MEQPLTDFYSLQNARTMISLHGQSRINGDRYNIYARIEYDGAEYPPSYATALRCIDRMMPKEPVIHSGQNGGASVSRAVLPGVRTHPDGRIQRQFQLLPGLRATYQVGLGGNQDEQ